MSNPALFRKKPITVQAMVFDGSRISGANIADWMAMQGAPGIATFDETPGQSPVLMIQTLEGDMQASPGDWIIRGVQGEFYPCKPEIFAATYDAA